MRTNQNPRPKVSAVIFATTGIIEFICRPNCSRDAQFFLEQLELVDKKFPWKARWPNGKPAPSIGRHEEIMVGNVVYMGKQVISYLLAFGPPQPLKTGQFHAYHHYVCRLAYKLQKLANRDWLDVLAVCGQLHIETCREMNQTLMGVLYPATNFGA